MTTLVEKYWLEGCMRCKFGATPQCKVLLWVEELKLLRQIVLETGLTEEIKWGVPVYTFGGKNIVSVNALKESANISFFKGALLADEHQILQQQGNIQSGRIAKFISLNDIEKFKEVLISYVLEAIQKEKSGEKPMIVKNPEPIPQELLEFFENEPDFKKAFFALTLGKQRGYIIYFSQTKQAQTRMARIEKCKELIYKGIGLHDKYKS